MLGLTQKPIIKISNNQTFDDIVCIEEPLEIILEYYSHNQLKRETIAITMRTPGFEKELAIGFLYTEGIIDKYEEIEKIDFSFDCTQDETRNQQCVIRLIKHKFVDITKHKRHFYTSSSCGVCGKTSIDLSLEHCPFILIKSIPQLEKEILLQLPEKLKLNQEIFSKTGGSHGVGLFDTKGNMICVMEDVGRHNAMDKLIGYVLVNNLNPLKEHVIVVSGRASFELIQKSLCIACSIFIAVGAPSSLAVEIANEFNMTLIGFTKNNSANIYSCQERIVMT
jgi:FdhD protein